MRQRSFIVLALALTVLVVGAVGVYAYDKTRNDVIAKGISAGGVDLSGMHPKQAREALRQQLAAPLQKPVVVKYAGHRYKLSPKQAKVRVNTADMVQQALDASRTGNLITRTARALTGGSVHKSIKVEVTYSGRAVAQFTKSIQGHIDQQPVDATISIGSSGVSKVDSKDGRQLDVQALRNDVAGELVEATADHKVDAPVQHIKAKVSTADLAKKYPSVIIINRGGFQLTLYKNLQVAHTYRIAVGRQGLETPAGQYNIQDKQVNPSWHVPNSAWAGSLAGKVIPPGPADPIKARWMGIAGGAGIHGTDDVGSLGSAASHGCIRMAIPDVISLFDQVNVGDPVFIS
ncbi:MAG: L,D-transpeptidase ErfK/SrfK [Solirubrobacteraceae bacterium]|jgi:lipoprotein-anchoring transpeptidase ErfK/SrfK|nr:L,D-transpeptidase ErfK/SrfK [Solirubrobacteraceae bacterium]